MKILICDDAGFVRAILSELCRSLGHEIVAECRHTLEVESALEQVQPDLIFIDAVLPRQNAISYIYEKWTNAIQSDAFNSTHIILMSSLGIDFLQSKLVETFEGRNIHPHLYCLNKPFEIADIQGILSTIEKKKRRAG